jgi:hypothetical protein
MLKGWSYFFTAKAPPREREGAAARATLDQFQSFPANEVQGRGTLVSQNGVTGEKYWNIMQPPQVYAHHTGVTESLTGAGSVAGGLYGAALVPNPNSTGFS